MVLGVRHPVSLALYMVAAAQVGDETTKTGAPKETFGTGTASQSEAGKKGAEISGAAHFRIVVNV